MNKKIYRILAIAAGLACVGCLIWLALYLIGVNREEQEMKEMLDAYVSVETEGPEETQASSEETVPEESSKEPSKEAPEQSDQAEPSEEEASEETVSEEPSPEEESSEESSAEAKEQTEQTEESTEEAAAKPSTDPLSRKIDFAGLQKNKNKDIYAWISVPGTVIDYPVLQHPDEMDYYLNHNLNGSTGYPGCIYTQLLNSKDWSDFNTVLYGHNMKNGTYFAGLHKFEKESFFQKNRYIYIYTEDGRILTYEIFAAHVSGNEHQLLSYSTNTDEGRQSYLSGLFANTGSNCHYLEDRTLSASDRIITLATCISGQADKRYLVQGVLVDERQP